VLSIPHSCEKKPSEPVPVYSLHIEQIEQPIIQYALIDELPSHENCKIIHITVRGVVLIDDDINPNGILIADDGEHEYPVNWKIPSPLFKTKYPKNPNAINARFKIEGLQVSSLRATDIYFQDELANRHLLFRISLIKED
jgi:hypothetical protein